jgi:hypothetical protein
MTARTPSEVMAASDLRTKMVREQVQKENAEFDARTAKLKALRLAKEVGEPVKPKRMPKQKRKSG